MAGAAPPGMTLPPGQGGMANAMMGAGMMGFAEGGKVSETDDLPPHAHRSDRQLGLQARAPEDAKMAKGGKVRKFNSAAAPAENLPTHPGKKKMAKGGVLRRKPPAAKKARALPPPTPQQGPDDLDNALPPSALAAPGPGGPPPVGPPGGLPGMKKGGKWIQGAIKHPGALHKQLGVPQGEKIPAKKLAKAAEAGGTLGKRARLAETLKGFKKAKGGKCENCGKAHGGSCKMAAGGAAKQRRGFPMTEKPPKKFAGGGRIRGCGVATKGCNFSGIY